MPDSIASHLTSLLRFVFAAPSFGCLARPPHESQWMGFRGSILDGATASISDLPRAQTRLSSFSASPPPTNYWLLATGYWLLATGYQVLRSRTSKLRPRAVRPQGLQHASCTNHSAVRRARSWLRSNSENTRQAQRVSCPDPRVWCLVSRLSTLDSRSSARGGFTSARLLRFRLRLQAVFTPHESH